MSSEAITSRPISIDRAASSGVVSWTSWGEESRIRIGPADSGGELTILDYRAPASSSPFLTIALQPASGRLDIFITGRMRFLN